MKENEERESEKSKESEKRREEHWEQRKLEPTEMLQCALERLIRMIKTEKIQLNLLVQIGMKEAEIEIERGEVRKEEDEVNQELYIMRKEWMIKLQIGFGDD
jgi:hypothetical protein